MRILFAGGGTGGHLFPAIAMARGIAKKYPDSEVLFVGTRQGIESRILTEEGWTLKTIRIKGLKGKKGLEQVQALWALPMALIDSLLILRGFRPDAVIGVGGYASGPVVLAGYLSRRRLFLQEQNSVPGITNRILGKLVDRIYTAYAESHAYFPKKKVIQMGNPLREGLGKMAREDAIKNLGLTPDKKTVLVLGGSSGARAVNQIVTQMLQFGEWSDQDVQFIHQSGQADFDEISGVYENLSVPSRVEPFFRKVEEVYAASDLAVSRAGAVALSELCVVGLPSILIPFPYATDDHQIKNARVMENAGAAEVLPQEGLTHEKLGSRLRALIHNAKRLSEMREAALGLGRPHATEEIVEDMVKMIQKES